MSDVILEKVNSAVKKAAMEAAMKELRNQIETVYDPWDASFRDDEQKELQIGNENYDAFRSNMENRWFWKDYLIFFQTEKSHETRHYFYNQAVDQLELDPQAQDDETDLLTLSKERGMNLKYQF